jgi:hypothetical protein
VGIRTIDGPGKGTEQYVDRRKAADHMGVTPEQFEKLAEEFASDWLRHLWVGNRKMWAWEEVYAFCIYYRCLQRVSGAGQKNEGGGGKKKSG